jgi:hypothetical protein
MTISPLPLHVVQGLSITEIKLVNYWWNHLAEEERTRLLAQWDVKNDSWANAPSLKDNRKGPKPRISIQVCGNFVDEELQEIEEEFPNDFYEYLVNHEMFLVDLQRSFHICTQHPEAQKAIRHGKIPSDFHCPFKSQDCPMQTLMSLSSERSVALDLELRVENE